MSNVGTALGRFAKAGDGFSAGRSAVIGLPYLWLLIFFLLPFLILLNYSVSEMEAVRP